MINHNLAAAVNEACNLFRAMLDEHLKQSESAHNAIEFMAAGSMRLMTERTVLVLSVANNFADTALQGLRVGMKLGDQIDPLRRGALEQFDHFYRQMEAENWPKDMRARMLNDFPDGLPGEKSGNLRKSVSSTTAMVICGILLALRKKEFPDAKPIETKYRELKATFSDQPPV